MFPFVVRNEQHFKNLHGVVGNKERFIAYLQSEILIFFAFVSLGDLTFFFFGQHDSGFGQHDFGQDDFQAT